MSSSASTRQGRLLRLLLPTPAPSPKAAEPSRTVRTWRSHLLTRVGFLVLAFVVLTIVPGVVMALGTTGPAPVQLAAAVVAGAAGIGLYVLAVRLVEGRPVVELDRRTAVPGLVRGALIGIGMFTAVIGIIAALGLYRVTGTGTAAGVMVVLAVSVYAGVIEELTFRGVVFRVLEELTGTWVALAVSAAAFGGLHLLNPRASVWGAVAIALEAGVMLGAAYVLTRRLWVPIALHAAWNFTQGGIFGVTVSGSDLGQDGLLTSRLSGPALLSGGDFGAEASIVAVLVGTVLSVLFLRLAVLTGQVKPPLWSRSDRAQAGALRSSRS